MCASTLSHLRPYSCMKRMAFRTLLPSTWPSVIRISFSKCVSAGMRPWMSLRMLSMFVPPCPRRGPVEFARTFSALTSWHSSFQ